MVGLLVTAYGANGTLDNLIHAAAAESASFGNQLNLNDSAWSYNELANKTGCISQSNPIACLRALPVETLQASNNGYTNPLAPQNRNYDFLPTVDGDLIPDYTQNLMQQGKFMRIPVIFGDDTNEGTMFVPKATNSVQAADAYLRNFIQGLNESQLEQINEVYLSEPDDPVYEGAGQYWQGTANAYGEIKYICAGLVYSDSYNSDPTTAGSTWNYHYAVTDNAGRKSGLGTQHTIEINAIWGPEYVSSSAPASYSYANAPIVPLMQGYWTSFIRDFNPNTYRQEGSPEWDNWGDEGNRIFIRTNDTYMETVPDDQYERCSLFTPIWYGPRP